MNESERDELEQLTRRLMRMRVELRTLDREFDSLEQRLRELPAANVGQASRLSSLVTVEGEKMDAAGGTHCPTPGEGRDEREVAKGTPPVVASQPSLTEPMAIEAQPLTPIFEQAADAQSAKPAEPEPSAVPPVIQPAAPAFAQIRAATLPEAMPASAAEFQPVPALADAASANRQEIVQAAQARVREVAADAPPVREKASFEMRLGTFWLVRIGIVVLLTGLVFFGAYAYENFIPKLGAGGKISLLYLASGLLLGAGAWLLRQEQKLRNYAQVLVAGGLAAVYFTTYAAHHIPNLAIIHSALLDGALLLGWAGFIVWLADRTKSEVLALFAVLLAYYSSVITNIGLFTLYSNLVLTIAAVFFLLRNRWATLSFVSLVATYASYGFWRFFHGGEWQWASPADGLWTGNYFLMSYWLIFTAALFLSKHEQFAGGRRVTFLSLNNSAFLAAFVLTMLQVRQGGFWKFSLIYGSVLLGLTLLARRLRAEDKLFRNAYLTQGLLLVTLGFVTYFTGLRLSLVLAVESVMLVVLGQQLQNRVMRIAAFVAAALAVTWGVPAIHPLSHHGLLIGSVVGAAMLFNAWRFRKETVYDEGVSHVPTMFFTTLGLLMWFVATWQNTMPHWRGLAMAVEATCFLLAARPLSNRVLSFGAIAFSSLAVTWLSVDLLGQWNPAEMSARAGLAQGALIGGLMLANALWQRRFLPPLAKEKVQAPVAVFACLALVAWLVTTWTLVAPPHVATVLAVEAVLLTALYYPTRQNELPAGGQVFLMVGQGGWLYAALSGLDTGPWWNPAAVIAMTLGLSHWWQRQKQLVLEKGVVGILQGVSAFAIIALLYFWLRPDFGGPAWLAFTSLLALATSCYALVTRAWLLLAAAQAFMVISGVEFVWQLANSKPEWFIPLAPIAALLALSLACVAWLAQPRDVDPEISEPVLKVGLLYRGVAVLMAFGWIQVYVGAREQCWTMALIGLVLFALAGWRRNREMLLFGATFSLAGIVRFWAAPLDATPSVYWPNLLAVLALAAQQRFAKRWPEHYRLPPQAHAGVIVLAGLSVWLYLTRWIGDSSQGIYLTATWSGLALVLFVAGMLMRERVYRWVGLGVLACALGHVAIFDLRRLEAIYRILSLLALGVVLLLLGFLYNKYQERIKEWL